MLKYFKQHSMTYQELKNYFDNLVLPFDLDNTLINISKVHKFDTSDPRWDINGHYWQDEKED